MNLDQLEAVITIVEKGSFRAAAEALHRSQPALSTSVKNLEEEFGLLIFDRAAYRPRLTEAGAAFLQVARATLDSAHYTSRVARELGRKHAETKLIVSMDPLISNAYIAAVAEECARPVLPVNLVIKNSIFRGSYQDLLDGKTDLAFAPCPRDTAKIERILLEEVTLVGAVARPLLQAKRRATAAFLAKTPQILTYDRRPGSPARSPGESSASGATSERPDEFFPDAVNASPGHKIFVPDHPTKLRLIKSAVGWGRISKTEIEASEGLTPIDKNLCETVTLELCLLRARHRPLGPVAQAIWKTFRALKGQ